MSRLCEEFKIVPILQPADHQAAAVTCDSINMKNYLWCTFVIQFGDLTANAVLQVNQGATDASDTATLACTYRLGSAIIAAANSDVLGDETALSTTLTLTAATYEDKILIIECDPAAMTDGYDWLTLYTDATATEQFMSAIAILKPKYAGAALHTALA